MNGKCALCNKETELQLSHIIPKFVLSWLKETGGAIRASYNPNQRVQDGEKQYLLCPDCEENFSRWEKIFYERIFLPLHSYPNLSTPIKYGPWALKFAVSVSWRVLIYYYQLGDLSHYSERQREIAQIALGVWRRFLLGELPHPEQFEQHLLPVDAIGSYSGSAISPFLNRYLLRSVHMSVLCSNTSAIVYTKMGHLILFGFIQEDSSKRWKGTKIHMNKGLIKPRVYRLPQNIADYFNEQANVSAKALASTSPRQKQLIKNTILENADKFVNCEIFRAMQYDVYHSGKNAFNITETLEDNETES